MSDFSDLDQYRDQASESQQAQAENELYFGSVDDFVREKLVHMYARKVGPQNVGHHRWAADWWNYPEALSRREAIWRAWEHLRQGAATGMSVWWRDHADPHMAVLLSPDGPFAYSHDRNERGEALPYTPPPDGLFPDMRGE